MTGLHTIRDQHNILRRAALEKRYRGDDIEDAEPPDEWARENVLRGGSPHINSAKVKAKPPDKCAPENVYRGGSPLSIIGEATCNVSGGLGIEILFFCFYGDAQ